MKIPYKIAVYTCIIFLLNACSKTEVEIPSYLYLDEFTVNASTGQGNNTSAITNAQVFIDGTFVGDYELPVTFPVLRSGTHTVQVFPSVKENGVSNGRQVFKLYEPYTIELDMEKGKIDSLKPTTRYKDNVVFEWVEDFDDNAISMSKGVNNQINDSLRTYFHTDSKALQMGKGFSAGVVFPLNSNGLTWEVVTNAEFEVPNSGREVYMEMDLKSDISITIGIVYENATSFVQTEVVTFFPTNGAYKKLYLNLESETSPLPATQKISIFIGGANFLGDAAQPEVFLDNIKLAYLD